MAPEAEKDQAKQQQKAFEETSKASLLVRNALLASLPVSPEQYLTVSVPGTLIDTTDIEDGGSYVYNATKHPFTPTAVRQAEAKLVDGMIPLASVMVLIYKLPPSLYFSNTKQGAYRLETLERVLHEVTPPH